MKYEPGTVSLARLLLDPNNYRFFDMEDYVPAAPNRLHEQSVQKRADDLVKRDGRDELRALKESIEVNGYVPIETLVVKPYEYKENLYVVVEGNRRVAAMRWLQQDKEGGSPISEDLIATFEQLPAITLRGELQNAETVQHIIMGLRHVSGIKQWGGYQRAKLLVELVEDFGFSRNKAAKQIGMSSHEALRRYRAYKALEQMSKDEEFGSSAIARVYRLFHEAVSIVKVKEWLGWDDDEYRFTNENELKEFYRLLVPYAPEDEEETSRAREPKIRTYLDVRTLREILGNVEAEECLFDPNQSFAEALAVAKASAAPNWSPRIRAASQTLSKIPTNTLKNLTGEDIRPLKDLYVLLKETLEDWQKLTGNPLEQ